MRYSDLTESLTVGMLPVLKKHLAAIEDDYVRDHVSQWLEATFANAMNLPTYGGYGFERKYALPLAQAVHAVTDPHMREFLTHWTYEAFGGQRGVPYSTKDWEFICTTGQAPKMKLPRPRTFKKFEELYQPVPMPDGSIQRQYDQIPPGTPDNLIWTVHDSETGTGKDTLTAGFAHGGYSWVICRRPFPENEYSGLGFYF